MLMMHRPNTTELNEKGEGLCCVCRRKFGIEELNLCNGCDRWMCKAHTTRVRGIVVCTKCANK